MKFPKRMLAWMLSVVMVFGLTGTMVFASEGHTSDVYNHGTIQVTAGNSDTITISKGGTAEITITPYQHRQYAGCQMVDGNDSCPNMCEGMMPGGCFVKDKGCRCDETPVLRTAAVTKTVEVVQGSGSIVAVGDPSPVGTVGSTVGSTVDGKMVLTGTTAGKAKVTVTVSLCDWKSVTKEFTVIVTD